VNASHTFHVRTDTPIRTVALPECFPGIHIEIGDGLYLHLTTESAEALQAVLNGSLMKANAIREAEGRGPTPPSAANETQPQPQSEAA